MMRISIKPPAEDTDCATPMPETNAIQTHVLSRLKAIVGPQGWIEDKSDKAAYLVDFRNLYQGVAPIVLRPAITEEVSAIVKLCSEAGIGIVPQGGNTGYCGGATPNETGNEIVVALTRMNQIRQIDPLDDTITVEAGCVLKDIQAAAESVNRLFPLSLAAEGSCQIGGNLSTNAGGTAVLRYGNTRSLALGLEVVLPDGEIWNGLRLLRKDNTGYDLKQLFIGAEGTLGIITAATLKLYPRPVETCTAFVALADSAAAVRLLARTKDASGDGTTTFEYIDGTCLDLVFSMHANLAAPFTERHAHYALIEMSANQSVAEAVLSDAFEADEILDAVIAASGAQAANLWKLRESIPEAQNHAGGVIRHDVSVPVSRVPEFLARARIAADKTIAGVRIAPFGHIGDGNIHFNLVQPKGANRAVFLKRTHDIEVKVHDIATDLHGSFSAEHGIGQLKRDELIRYKQPVEREMMLRIKEALDPNGLMNPGKVL